MSTTSGWGRFTWGQAEWNEDVTLKTGWGAQQWSGDGGWGDLSDQTVSVSLTGIQITSSIGSVTVADMQVGLTGLESTFSQGEAFVPVNIDGVSFSASVGSLTVNDVTLGLTGQEITSVLGTPVVADMTVGMTGLDLTLSQGTAFAPNDTVIVSGQEITLSQGTAVGSSSQEASLTGIEATFSLGSVTVPNDTVIVADASNSRIRSITPSGVTSTIAGTDGFGLIEDGPALSSIAYFPLSVTVGDDNNVYFSGLDNCVRRIVDGELETLAGLCQNYSNVGTDDGDALDARFDVPRGLYFNSSDELMIADANNSRIRVLSPDFSEVSTIAGTVSGFADGPLSEAACCPDDDEAAGTDVGVVVGTAGGAG